MIPKGLQSVGDVVSGNTIDVGYAHGLITGDSVVYRSNGGNPIGGLVDGTKYYVVVVTPTSFQLTANLAAILVANPDVLELGALPGGTHVFTQSVSATGALGNVTLAAAGSIVNADMRPRSFGAASCR